VDALRLLLNLIWLVVQGWILALAYLVAGVIACLLVVTIPFGIASFRLAAFVVWPFGRTTVRAPGAGLASAVGNLLWFLVAGWGLLRPATGCTPAAASCTVLRWSPRSHADRLASWEP
jgi:uncharacterized membrane protein YccF (DUF307 family)